MPEKTYNYHKPSPDGLRKITDLRRWFSELHDRCKAHCPESRELSIALTHLETSAMYAIKAVVSNDPESVIDPL